MMKSFKKLVFLGVMISLYVVITYAFGNESICVFKVYTGLPCPGCGMTRAFLSLFNGDWHQSFYWHPLWPLVVVAPVLYWRLSMKTIKNKRVTDYFLFALIFIFVLTFFVRMFLFFPHTAPMDYNQQSWFAQMYHWFHK